MQKFSRFICLLLASFALIATKGEAMPSGTQNNPVTPRHHGATSATVRAEHQATYVPTTSTQSSRRVEKPYSTNSITVNTTTDAVASSPTTSDLTAGGKVSLRSAIQYLNDGGTTIDTIYVPAGTYTLTVTGAGEQDAASGDLDVNASVILVGRGTDSTFVVGDADRVFDINPLGNTPIFSVTIADMTVKDGTTVPAAASEDGGGININMANLTLDTVDVNSNAADGNGGGINITSGGGTLVMNGGTLDSNSARNTAGATAIGGPGNGGGANFDGGSATFNNAMIERNFSDGQGGAVHIATAGVSIALNNCTVYRDTSNTGWGGAFSLDHGDLTINGGVIRGNVAPADGGAIDNADSGFIHITNATLDSNSSSAGGAIGVEVSNAATTLITGCRICQNFTASFPSYPTSAEAGAAYIQSPFTIKNSVIDSNTSGKNGGALYLAPGQTDTLENDTLLGNISGQGGGAIYNDTYPVYFSNVVISNNTAQNGDGGGVYDYYGGLNWINGQFTGNTASNLGGGFYFVGNLYNDTLKYVTYSSNNPTDIDTSADTYGTHVILIDKPLAVQATDFIATTEGSSVSLSWNTQSEDGNAGFDILRKTAGEQSFVLIASYTSDDSLRGLGTSSTGRTYNFTDTRVTPGDTYTYMIQSVSTKGAKSDLTTLNVTVNAPKTFALFQNYPNPFNPSTTVRFDLKEQSTVSLAIYNVLGQLVKSYEYGQMSAGEYNKTINMSNDASGVYFYQIIAQGLKGDRFESVKKLMLTK